MRKDKFFEQYVLKMNGFIYRGKDGKMYISKSFVPVMEALDEFYGIRRGFQIYIHRIRPSEFEWKKVETLEGRVEFSTTQGMPLKNVEGLRIKRGIYVNAVADIYTDLDIPAPDVDDIYFVESDVGFAGYDEANKLLFCALHDRIKVYKTVPPAKVDDLFYFIRSRKRYTNYALVLPSRLSKHGIPFVPELDLPDATHIATYPNTPVLDIPDEPTVIA